MSRAVLGLGSNLGDRWGHLERAVAALGDAIVAVSPIHETEPWGDLDQPWFLNQIAIVQDENRSALDWLRFAQRLERDAGRVRDENRQYGPRTLDVDVIAVDDLVSDDPELTLPHPRAHLRRFVLEPWSEIDPDAELPGVGRVVDLLRSLTAGD